MTRRLATPAALLLSLALSGCAALQTPPAPTAPIVRTYQSSIEQDGRISVRYQRNAAEESMHGSFSWQQTRDHTVITLSSPLGQTLAVIDVTPERAVLTQAGQPPRTAADADALAAETLGWPLPVAGLRDWLQGFAVDAQGKPWVAQPGTSPSEVATQDGWRISYLDWREENGSAYPRRIDLARDTKQAGPVAIRIVVDHSQTK